MAFDSHIKRSGSSLEDIFYNRDPFSYQSTDLNSHRCHSVLYHLPLPDGRSPSPQRGTMIWDQDHVRMPCDPNCQYVEIDASGNKILKSRWSLIEEVLLEKPIQSSYELERVIKSYNSRYETLWDFSTLHELFQVHYEREKTEEFFSFILPNLINLALQLPQIIQSPIPLLKEGMNRLISMSQQQAASLLANAFLCTFPRRNTDKKNSEFSNYPEINFNRLFGCRGQNIIEKLKCVFNYFERFFRSDHFNVLTFQRISNDGFQWQNCGTLLSATKFHITSSGKIEDSPGMIQVDFANRFVGGGVLGHGAVQEEIRFLMSPEMIVAKLFTESLADNEALLMIGCEQFNKYSGYASSFKFDGDFFDATPLDPYRRRKTRVVAIDALSYQNFYEQFREQTIRRELNKAFVGFRGNEGSPIATGLWGCGAFNGYSIRSALIQLMACAATKRSLVFYTFGDELVRDEIADVFTFLNVNNVRVEQLYKVLKKYRFEGDPKDPTKLVAFIKRETETKKPTSVSLQKPTQTQSKLFNFAFTKTQQKPSKFLMSQSSQEVLETIEPRQSQAAFSTQQKFNEFEDVFKDFIKPKTQNTIEKKKPEPKKKSLLDCLDEDFK